MTGLLLASSITDGRDEAAIIAAPVADDLDVNATRIALTPTGFHDRR